MKKELFFVEIFKIDFGIVTKKKLIAIFLWETAVDAPSSNILPLSE